MVLADGADSDVDLRVRALSAHAAAAVPAAVVAGDVRGLDLAVERYRSAAALCLGPDAPAATRLRYLTYLTNLADVLRQRHQHTGGRHDLDESVTFMEDVVARTSEGDPDLPWRQAVLASLLSMGDLDLDRAMCLFALAYSETATADPRRASILTNLEYAHVAPRAGRRLGGPAPGAGRAPAGCTAGATAMPARKPTMSRGRPRSPGGGRRARRRAAGRRRSAPHRGGLW